MATSQEPYFNCIRATLEAALCIENFPSQIVERHNKPEVEAGTSKELLLNPVTICRTPQEKCRIEGSINSIRISLSFQKNDDLEILLARRYMRFLMQRAEHFLILRRKPVDGFDISFLITNFHTEDMYKDKLIDFVINFMKDIAKEMNDLKLKVTARARLVAKTFLRSFT
jgi:hypothetical protein